jgi:hypothetical protein
MPFFEPASPAPFEEQQLTERVWAPPRWDRPSEGTLPTVVGISQPFARTDNVVFALVRNRKFWSSVVIWQRGGVVEPSPSETISY